MLNTQCNNVFAEGFHVITVQTLRKCPLLRKKRKKKKISTTIRVITIKRLYHQLTNYSTIVKNVS